MFVRCALSDIEEEPIRLHFSVCGAVTNVRVIRDQTTGAGKGFGYVTFSVISDNLVNRYTVKHYIFAAS